MIILHALTEEFWKSHEGKEHYGNESIEKEGFIHCSDIDTYKYVSPNFKNETKKMFLLLIDTDKVIPEVVWEDLYDCGIQFPHIYGLLNKDAIIGVLPHLWSEDRVWIMNEELINI